MSMRKLTTITAAICAAAAMADTVAPGFVTDEAVFWLDASALDAAAGTELDSWADVRGGSYPGVTTYTTTKPQVIEIADGALAGKKAVTFFTVGTACDMKFAANQTVRTAFFVVDMDQRLDAFLLGGVGANSAAYYPFHRGANGAYYYGYSAPACSYWNDGVKIASPTTEILPTGYQLVTWQLDASITPVVNRITRDREVSGRVGGKRLCEVIAFNRHLSDDERSAVEGYLKAKWYGTMSQETATFAMRINKFGKPQVHFDASEASSFHYEVEGDETGTKVSKWDDLSGNNNHFVTNITSSTPNYGTVGTVAGKPVFDSGAAASGIDLKLGTPVNARTVFLVAEVDRSGNTFWLGDSDHYRFHRGSAGQYAYNNNNVLIRAETGGNIWCNGDKVTDAVNTYPEMPGGLSVYVFTTSSNAQWGRLGLDRTSTTTRHGGKRVAELVSFASVLSEDNRKLLEKMLMEKWRPSDAYVDSVVAEAAIHVDASSADNFTYTDGRITGWKNSGTAADLYRPETQYSGDTTYEPAYGSRGYTNGVPAFLMGTHGSTVDLMFTRLTNVRSVFWVMDIVRDKDGFFLGDAKIPSSGSLTYHFHRQHGTPVGAYANGSYGAAFLNAITRCDRVAVASVTTERPPLGTHVYDLVTKQNYTAASLSKDRDNPTRNGGRAISELLIFTTPVAGLTRDAISERLENKWTRSCGWAGAGDAEWGAGKYRVFDADAAVPAEGAEAAGVGFTSDATLSGGTLTLGDGGFFASEGAAVTVSAPVAGKLGVYGPGTVALTTAPATIDSISVGYGATLTLPAGETAVSGGLSIQENAKLVIDVSALAARQHAVITFANLTLPAGGTLLDYVSLAGNTQGHVLTIGADGVTIHVNDSNVAMAAEWNGGANDLADVAANWRCRNFDGVELPGALPCFRTTNVVFNGDCDLRGWGTPVFADGAYLDLKGHTLKVADLSDDGFMNAVVTNSVDDATAELQVEVADGKTATNATVSILGNVKVVKTGLGTWRAAKKDQTYSGGTLILEGVLENGIVDARNYTLGAVGSTIAVSTNGANRGVFDIKGMYAQNSVCAAYRLVMNGGLVQNTGSNAGQLNGQFFDIRLTADSEFSQTYDWGMFDGATEDATLLDLGGHTLKVAIGTNGRTFHLVNAELKNGFIDVTSGGWFQTGLSGHVPYLKEIVATNVDFRIASAMKIYAPLSVRDYEQVYGSNNNDGTGVFSVYGTFKPAAHNYFYGVTMMNGSMIDLSQRTSALPAVSSFTKGKNDLDFAEDAVVAVKLGEWNVPPRSKIISWSVDAKPTNVGTVRFVSGDEGRTRYFSKRSDGLYLSGGLVIIVR